MPYIDPLIRAKLNPHVDRLAEAIVKESEQSQTDFAGLLNYASTRTALKVIKLKFGKMRYWILAIITGVFINVVFEIYRRIGAPYEDRQIAKNGDVDIIDEFLRDFDDERQKSKKPAGEKS